MRRRDLLPFLGMATVVWSAWAQVPPKQYRIAIADRAFTETEWRNFLLYRPLFPELRRLGDVEGVNLQAEYFTAEGHVADSGDYDRPFRPKVITDSGDRDHALTRPIGST